MIKFIRYYVNMTGCLTALRKKAQDSSVNRIEKWPKKQFSGKNQASDAIILSQKASSPSLSIAAI